MTIPMASQTTKRTRVTHGRLTIRTSEAMMERIGIHGTNGTQKARRRLGCVRTDEATLLIVNDEVLLARLALRVAIHTFLLREAPMRNQHRLWGNNRLYCRSIIAPACKTVFRRL